MMWKRLEIAKLKDKNIGDGDDDELFGVRDAKGVRTGRAGLSLKYVYGKDGKQWPRLTLSISERAGEDKHIYYDEDSFTIGCDMKDNPDSWWGEAPIPLSLAKDAAAMLGDYMAIKQSSSDAGMKP